MAEKATKATGEKRGRGRPPGKVEGAKLTDAIREIFPLTPKGIIEYLNLRRAIYKKTAAYGHFGRNEEEFTWERTDKADALRGYLRK